ncbi:GNAT family N-acetyltransferase [Moorena sp. SIO4G3]|uniref:GNAT family N-acetyltransferase n=1 Tax=Moorena sp. SIO4G3 TaxID=2607821 RepID=UPI00142B3811|nr:GNAT family N-acetyltransferase [Moorena sp. SIO4G3]NEO79451.1 GNAT family N-acetyltransferase [Moorena sp. SIO4G3]
MTSHSIYIRPVIPYDIPILFELIMALAAHEKLSHKVTGTCEQLHKSLFSAHPDAEAIIACVNGVPTGFALYFFNFSVYLMKPGLYLEALFVLPKYRRQGVGSKMFCYLAKMAVDKGCGRFEWSLLNGNESAIAFYQQQGATFLHDWRTCRLAGDALAAFSSA